MANGTHEQEIDQAELLAQMFPKDSIEYKLLLKYAQKKKLSNSPAPQCNGVGETIVASPTQPEDFHKQKKHKKRRPFKLLTCFRPVKEDDNPVITNNRKRGAALSSGSDKEGLEQIVNNLTKITDCVHFITSDIESDSDDIVERIVELLREQGDKLNTEIENDHMLRKQLQDSLSYSFFVKVTKSFMDRLSPQELPTAHDQKQAELALTCELTSRLNTMDCHPMNRVLGFGAKYLQDYFTPWVIQQGGYEKVFGTNDDVEEEVQ